MDALGPFTFCITFIAIAFGLACGTGLEIRQRQNEGGAPDPTHAVTLLLLGSAILVASAVMYAYSVSMLSDFNVMLRGMGGVVPSPDLLSMDPGRWSIPSMPLGTGLLGIGLCGLGLKRLARGPIALRPFLAAVWKPVLSRAIRVVPWISIAFMAPVCFIYLPAEADNNRVRQEMGVREFAVSQASQKECLSIEGLTRQDCERIRSAGQQADRLVSETMRSDPKAGLWKALALIKEESRVEGGR